MTRLFPLVALFTVSYFIFAQEADDLRSILASQKKSFFQEFIEQEKIKAHLIEQNKNAPSIAQIILIDSKWSEESELRNDITKNALAQVFKKKIESRSDKLSELMLTDKNGALLSAYPITTDYWQGDEEKFTQAIINQSIYVSDYKWDDSTNRYSFFLTIPLYSEDVFLGALIIGIDVTKDKLLELDLEDLLKISIQPND